MTRSASDEVTLTVVCPFYNAEAALEPFHEEFRQVADALGIGYEIIFVNDGSTDESLAVLRSLARRDSAVRYLDLSRRFGSLAGWAAGCEYATGQAVLAMDIGRPLDRLGALLDRWRGGWEIVDAGAGVGGGIGPILLDHKAAKAFCQWYDPARPIEQTFEAIGFRRIVLSASAEAAGSEETHRWPRLRQAISNGRWCRVGGLIATGVAAAWAVAAGILSLLGIATVSVAAGGLLVVVGLQLLCLGRLLAQGGPIAVPSARTPPYVIRHRHGFEEDEVRMPQRFEPEEASASRFTVFT